MHAGRSDHTSLQILLWLTAALSALAFVVQPVLDWIRGNPVEIGYTGPADLTELAAHGIEPTDDVDTEVALEVGVGLRLLAMVPGLLTFGAVLLAVALVIRVLRTVADGDPFVAVNFRRLQVLAGLAICSALLLPYASGFVDGFILSRAVPELDTFRLSMDVNTPLFLGGFVLAIVAEAFARGTRMREDLEGVI